MVEECLIGREIVRAETLTDTSRESKLLQSGGPNTRDGSSVGDSFLNNNNNKLKKTYDYQQGYLS